MIEVHLSLRRVLLIRVAVEAARDEARAARGRLSLSQATRDAAAALERELSEILDFLPV